MARDFAEAFYNSKKWKDMRKYILIRDQYRCQHCGSAHALEVHHIKPLSPETINNAEITLNDANLITLCRDCHFAVHEQDKANGTRKHNAARKRSDCGEEYIVDDAGFLVPKQTD